MKPIPVVYFLTAPEKKLYPVKIGRSNTASIHKRLADLQCAHPYRLDFLMIMEGGEAQELNAHRAFADIRLSGEWFKRTNELLSVINELNLADPGWRRLLRLPHIQYDAEGRRVHDLA